MCIVAGRGDPVCALANLVCCRLGGQEVLRSRVPRVFGVLLPSGLGLTLLGTGLVGPSVACRRDFLRSEVDLLHQSPSGSDMTARTAGTRSGVLDVKCAAGVHAALKAVECCKVNYEQGGKRLILKRCRLCFPGGKWMAHRVWTLSPWGDVHSDTRPSCESAAPAAAV